MGRTEPKQELNSKTKTEEGYSNILNFQNMNFLEYNILCFPDFLKSWNKIHKTHYESITELANDTNFKNLLETLLELLIKHKRAHQPIKFKTPTKILDRDVDPRAKEIDFYKWDITGVAKRCIYTILGEEQLIVFIYFYKKADKDDITNDEEQYALRQIIKIIDECHRQRNEENEQ